jgi:hypothetical protein
VTITLARPERYAVAVPTTPAQAVRRRAAVATRAPSGLDGRAQPAGAVIPGVGLTGSRRVVVAPRAHSGRMAQEHDQRPGRG